MPTTGPCAQQLRRRATPQPDQRAIATREADLAIEGMTCAACVTRVEKALNRVDGATASVSLATERAHVLVPEGVDDAELIAAVRGAGYDARPAADVAVDHTDVTAAAAARLLKGRRIAEGVRLFVAPGSDKTLQRLAADGLMQSILKAGAVVLPAGCGPCNDAVVGPLHGGEVSISTASNSNAGRFGAKDAQLFLGSPATVAWSAVNGAISDPRPVLDEVYR